MTARSRFRVALALLGALLGALAAAPALADAHRFEDDDDHERARAAVHDGAALPLSEIVARLGPRLDGRVVEVELEREGGRLIYEITLVTGSGRVRELAVDAATARLIDHDDDEEDDD